MTIAGLWHMLRQRGFIRDVHGTEADDLVGLPGASGCVPAVGPGLRICGVFY